jgi:hypothetical protein
MNLDPPIKYNSTYSSRKLPGRHALTYLTSSYRSQSQLTICTYSSRKLPGRHALTYLTGSYRSQSQIDYVHLFLTDDLWQTIMTNSS